MALDFDYRAPAYVDNEEELTEPINESNYYTPSNLPNNFRRIRWSTWTYDGHYVNTNEENKKKIIFMCQKCFVEKYIQDVKLFKGENMFRETVKAPVFTKYPGDQFLYKNLEPIDIKDADIIDKINEYAYFNFCVREVEKLKKQSK